MAGNINDVLVLDRAGVEVVPVKEPWLDSGGPARNLLLGILSWLAEEERRVLGWTGRRRGWSGRVGVA